MQYKIINEPNLAWDLIEQVFYNRNITDIDTYLNLTEDVLLDPYLLDNIKEAAETLKRHIENNNKIVLIVDSDADGYTSSALLLNYLYQFYPNQVENNITYYLHSGKQHGLNDLLYSFIDSEYSLVIIPDAGTNDTTECNILKELGKDIIILDHHEKENDNPSAIIVNNQISDKYLNKEISGVGVVYKFCKVYDDLLNVSTADNFVDLVAVGMGADMMQLTSYETAYLIREGIKKINNPFLLELSEKLSFSINKNGGLCPYTIGMYIAPQINAMIRMGTQEEKQLMFEAFLSYKADTIVLSDKRGHKPGETERLAVKAVRTCDRVKRLQKRLRDNALEVIENYISKDNKIDDKVIIIQLDPEDKIPKTLTGLVANQIMAKYKRPVLILNYDINSDTWSGSARGYETKGLESFKDFISDSNLSVSLAGHKNAFGVTFENSNVDKFQQYSNDALHNFDFSPYYLIDYIYYAGDINYIDISRLGGLVDIWGQGVPEPKLLIKNVKVTKDNLVMMAKGTVKITLPNKITMIKFGMTEEEFAQLQGDTGCVTIDVIGHATLNEYMGNISPQIVVDDYEIISKDEYYF